ncbi:MAG: thioredoxin family protein [Burkholderiaceae bacterium]|nr:thioredoxin family protein [Burkholderiaceae bacterium]
MQRRPGLTRWILAALLALLQAAAPAQPVRTEHVTAELVARQAVVAPGATLAIGLRLQHIPHWHTYWRNPGDSGLPTTLAWQLPAGSRVGEIEWPAPRRLAIGPLVNYGYEGELLLPLRFTAPADARPGSTLTLRAEANWLACREQCVPESATLTLALAVAAPDTPAGDTALAPLFDAAAAAAAGALQGWRVEAGRAGRELQVRLIRDRPPGAAEPLPPVAVFPYAEQVFDAARHAVYRTDEGYAVRLALAAQAAVPARLQGIVVATAAPAPWGGAHRSAEFSVALREAAALALPPGARRLDTDATAAGAVSKPAPAAAAGAASFWVALALALVGGMALNLMPCVFPVLSIKLLGLAQQADRPAALRLHALAYGLGVVLSFLALAAALLALRTAGSAVGWGFQLQEPGVVFLLALLFFAIGLNLIGAFDTGSLLPRGLANWRARRPAVDALGSGVLAVLAASPCTAPLMGATLGYAITEPAPRALALFAALGLGMALPYVALVLAPGWRHRLPRPGAWMLRLKQALAFPMFATVVWLVWVLGLQTGIDGAAKALLALLGLAASVWLIGVLNAASTRARMTRAAALLGTLMLLTWSWPQPLTDAGSGPAAARESGAGGTTVAARWQPYGDAAVATHLAAGRTVFVDFTAAWCVSCQVNKRLVLDRPATLADFDAAGTVLMRADWTRRNPEISAALARLGRNGVPVYALLRPGQEPLLLPEVLTPMLVRDALAGP